MYDEKFKKVIYEYALKNNKSIEDLTENDYKRIINEIDDEDFLKEYIFYERKTVINPMFKKAQEILYEASQIDDVYKTKELAQLAYETSPECSEALITWQNIEEDHNKKLYILDKGIKYEEEKLKRLGYFEEEYIGKFYKEVETRNYIRLLRNKLDVLIFVGRINIAKNLCLDILKLNKDDDLEVRYILLSIYAYQEDEENFLEFLEKLNETSIETLLPLIMLYYKLDKMDKVNYYLSQVQKMSSEVIPFFKKYLSECREDGFDFSVKLSNNILSIMSTISFLINTTPGLVFYIGMLE